MLIFMILCGLFGKFPLLNKSLKNCSVKLIISGQKAK